MERHTAGAADNNDDDGDHYDDNDDEGDDEGYRDLLSAYESED